MPSRYFYTIALLALLAGCQSTQGLWGRRALTSTDAQADKESTTKTAGLPKPTNVASAEPSKRELSSAEEHLRLGDQELEKDHYAQARTHFEEALRQDPGMSRAHHRLAVVGDKLKKYDEAERHYLAALKLDPKNAALLSDLGYSCWLQGRASDSERYLKQALQTDPDFKKAAANLGLLYGSTGRRDEALAMLRKVGTEAQAQTMLSQIDAMPGAADTQVAQNATALPNRPDSLPDLVPQQPNAKLNNLTRELFDRDAYPSADSLTANETPRSLTDGPVITPATSGERREREPSSGDQLPEIMAGVTPAGVTPFGQREDAENRERRLVDERGETMTDNRHGSEQPAGTQAARSLANSSTNQSPRQSTLWAQDEQSSDASGQSTAVMADASARRESPNVWPPRDLVATHPQESASHPVIQQAGAVVHDQGPNARHPLSSELPESVAHAHHEETADSRPQIAWTGGTSGSNRSEADASSMRSTSGTPGRVNSFDAARQQAALLGLGIGPGQLFGSLQRTPQAAGNGSRLPQASDTAQPATPTDGAQAAG